MVVPFTRKGKHIPEEFVFLGEEVAHFNFANVYFVF
jgi:hypothetical protein